MDARKAREKAFHEQHYAEDVRWKAVDKYYSIIEGRARYWEDFLRARCAGKRVLEYGCGEGNYTPRLAQFGGAVTGIVAQHPFIRTRLQPLEVVQNAVRSSVRSLEDRHLVLVPGELVQETAHGVKVLAHARTEITGGVDD